MDALSRLAVFLVLLVHLEVLVCFVPLRDSFGEGCFPDGAILLRHFHVIFCGASLGGGSFLRDRLGRLLNSLGFSNGLRR